MTSRSLLHLAVAVCLASAAAGCGGRDPNDHTLRLGLQDDFKSLDPAIGYDVPTWGLYHMLYDTLVTYDYESHLIPGLAASWKVEDAGKTYVFTLRKDVTFHDGRPMTSADVLYSFNRMLAPATRSPATEFYTGITGAKAVIEGKAAAVTGITAPDPYTVRIALDAPNLVFLQLIAMPFTSVVPRDTTTDQLARQPMGTGHFKFASWTPGQSVKLTRNAAYHGYDLGPQQGRAPDGVEYVLGVNENLEVLRFERGDLDFIGANRNVPAADYAYLSQDPKWPPYMLKAPDAAFHYVGMNCRVAPFDKRDVRLAIASAIDKARVIKLVNGRGRLANGILPPPMPGFNDKLAGIPYDPEKARRLLAAAGLPNGFSSTYYSTSSETEVKISQSIQQDLSKIGIKLELKPLAFPTFLDAKATPGRVTIASGNWSQDFPDPSNFLTTMFHSKNIKPHNSLNDSYYSNPKVDALLTAADSEPDSQKRLQDFRDAEALIVADAPVVPLYYPMKVQLRSPRVVGYKLHPIWGVELASVGVK